MTVNPITDSPTFRGLNWQAQWLFYNALREGPRPCGVIDVWPKRYAQLSAGIDEQFIVKQARELAASGIVLYDAETDEMMFPGYMADVTPANNARKVVAVVNSLKHVKSPALLAAAVRELEQLRESSPNAPAWADRRVIEALGQDGAK